MHSLVLRTTAQSFFDQSDPSVVPFKHLFRTEVSIETLFGSEKSVGHQILCMFREASFSCYPSHSTVIDPA
jgi:hypothetical protein